LPSSIEQEVINVLPKEMKGREAVSKRVTKLVMRRFFSGPLPPAGELAKYDKYIPGAGQQIIDYTNEEQKHRHLMDREIVSLQAKEIRFSLILAFIIALIFSIFAGICAYNGNNIGAGILVSATLLGIITKFIDGRKP